MLIIPVTGTWRRPGWECKEANQEAAESVGKPHRPEIQLGLALRPWSMAFIGDWNHQALPLELRHGYGSPSACARCSEFVADQGFLYEI